MARGHSVASYTVGTDDVATIIAKLSDVSQYLVDTVYATAAKVTAEVETFDSLRAADSVSHAQQCLIFAICSPQCRFAVNVRATVRMMARLYEHFETVDDVYQVITADKTDSWVTAGSAARSIFASLNFLRNVTDDDMSKAVIRSLRKVGAVKGLGEKTMAMALALYDANSEVYTLDVHMLRGLQGLADGVVAGSMTITDKAYAMLESGLIAWHKVHLPELPIFVSQWALWNAWGFNGEHVTHLGIFGL